MDRIRSGAIVAVIGVALNNAAFLGDIVKGEGIIWMGPTSWTVAAIGCALSLYGVYRIYSTR